MKTLVSVTTPKEEITLDSVDFRNLIGLKVRNEKYILTCYPPNMKDTCKDQVGFLNGVEHYAKANNAETVIKLMLNEKGVKLFVFDDIKDMARWILAD